MELRTAYKIVCKKYEGLMSEALQERRNQKNLLEGIGFSQEQVKQIIRDEKLSDTNLMEKITNLVGPETNPNKFMKEYERSLYQTHTFNGETILNLSDREFNYILDVGSTKKSEVKEQVKSSNIFRRYSSLKKIAAGAVLAAGLPFVLSVPAQADFYDGQRGPGKVQFDQRLSFGEYFNTNTLLKLYSEDKSFIDPALIVKIFTKDGKLTKYGCNFVGIIDDPFGYGEHVRIAGVLQVDRDVSKGETLVSPSLFSTIKIGKNDLVTIDPRAIYSVNLNGKDNFSYGCTLGVGSPKFRVGLDFSDSLNGKPEYALVTRMDKGDKEGFPKYWLQLYFNLTKNEFGIGFRYNWK